MASEANKNPWGGRFREALDVRVAAFTESVSFEQELCPFDLEGSIAHVKMLCKVGLLTESEKRLLVKGLEEIAGEIREGRFVFRPELEDIHMNIETALAAKVGDVAGKLHTARSRNDQVALDLRLWARAKCDAFVAALTQLQSALADTADQYAEAPMPAYTHVQRAQPVSCGHYLLSFVEMFQRDKERFRDCRKRANVLPLGAAAVAGTSLPIDRRMTAELLKFDGVTANSMDTVSDRDYLLELSFCMATSALHLSRAAEDLVLYASSEFGFFKLADSFSTGSSIMPQKKNPDVLELIRGKSAHAVAALTGLLTLLKGLPLTYNRDLQEDKAILFPAAKQLLRSLDIFAVLLRHSAFDTERMATACEGGFMDATALAEFLVRRGVPFRQAHHVVGGLVRKAEERQCRLADLTVDEMRSGHALLGAEARAGLNASGALRSYASEGSAHPQLVRKQIKDWRARLRDEIAAETAAENSDKSSRRADSAEDKAGVPKDKKGRKKNGDEMKPFELS